MNNQKMIIIDGNYDEIDNYLDEKNIKNIFLVCGKSLSSLRIGKYIEQLEKNGKVDICRFSDFNPNPTYESVVKGVHVFNKSKYDAIFAIGGGSAIDVAKCIKLFSTLDPNKNYLEQGIVSNDIDFLVAPTTAGTGSESTRFAVIYYKGEKKSVSHISSIPNVVVLDHTSLNNLPLYHRKTTMLDALCHSIESFWSVNSTIESRAYSKTAIKMIIKYKEEYLNNTFDGNMNMLKAANIAGKAIDISKTTAAHAMSYKISQVYDISHGHAVGLCLYSLFPYMISNLDKCIDKRGVSYLLSIFKEISGSMGCKDIFEAVKLYQNIYDDLDLKKTKINNYKEIIDLKNSVNAERLNNSPVKLDEESIESLYKTIFNIY